MADMPYRSCIMFHIRSLISCHVFFSSTDYEVHKDMILTMSIKDLLSSTKTKDTLTSLLAEELLAHFAIYPEFNLVVVHGNMIQCAAYEKNHTHEEADTLIPNQVMASVTEIGENEVHKLDIHVWSPDTDVLILLLNLVASQQLSTCYRLKFLTGKGTKYREIDVVERVRVIGQRKCQGLIGLHNFSGADWGGKFIGISKKTWVDAYMKLEDNDPVIDFFRNLGEANIPTELINDELPPQCKSLEEFVCRVYCSTGPTTIPALRWELFRTKNLEGEMLPPTRAALLPHITRVNYISMRDKSYPVDCPMLPPIEQNGWNQEEGSYTPVRCLALPAPRAVIELTKCGCKTGCKARCSCRKNSLPCTPLCKCSTGDCANIIKDTAQDNVEDE